MHTLPSSQASGAPGEQLPAMQMSPMLHALPSSQLAEFGTETQPIAGSHEFVVHTLPSSQSSGVPATQAPAWQISLPLHKLESAHELPSASA